MMLLLKAFDLEYDPRLEEQLREDQEMIEADPSWSIPLPATYKNTSSSSRDPIEASIDNDAAQGMNTIPTGWDIQNLIDTCYMAPDQEYGIVKSGR